MNWILIVPYAVIAVFLYFTRDFFSVLTIFLGIFVCSVNFKNRKFNKETIFSAFLLLVYVFLSTIFYAFNEKFYFVSLLFFAAGSAVFFIMFYISYKGKDMITGIHLNYKKQNFFLLAVKIFIPLALIMEAYQMLDQMSYNTAYLCYAAAFIALCILYRVEPRKLDADSTVESNAQGIGKNKSAAAAFALIMLIILCFKSYGSMMANNIKDSLFYFAAAVFFIRQLLEAIRKPGQEATGAKKIVFVDYVFVLIFIVAAYYLRMKDIYNNPPGSWRDDIFIFRTAGSMATYGIGKPYVIDPAVSGPVFAYWIISKFAFFTGGLSLYSDRLFAVLWGVINIAFIYLLALELFGRRAAVISALLTAVSFIHLLFSCASVCWIVPATIATMSFYFYFIGLRKGNVFYFVLAGFLIGFGIYFYDAGKLVPFIIIVYLLLALVAGRKNRAIIKNRLPGILSMVFTAVLTYYPIIVYAIQHPADYFGRVMQDRGLINLTLAQMSWQFPQNVKNAIMAFFKDSIPLGTMSIPSSSILDPVFSVLFILGLASIIFSIKKHSSLFLASWLIAGLAGGILSTFPEGVPIARSVLTFPVIFLLAGQGLAISADAFEKILGTPAKLTSPLILSCVLGAIAFVNTNAFYNVYKNDPAVKLYLKKNFYDIADTASAYKKDRVLLSEFFDANRFFGLYDVMLWRGSKYQYFNPEMLELSKIYNNEGKKVLLIAEGMYNKNINIYKEYFPDAVIKVHYNYDYWMFGNADGFKKLYGWQDPDYVLHCNRDRNLITADPGIIYINYISVEIPYGDIEALYGLNAKFIKDGAVVNKSVLKNTLINKEDSFDSIRLDGMIEAPYTGNYKMSADGADLQSIAINGIAVNKDRVYMVQGLNRIKFTIARFSSTYCKLVWQDPSGQSAQISAGNFILPHKIFGMDEKIIYKGNTVYKFHDYAISNRWYYDLFPRFINNLQSMDGFIRKWDGYITIDENGKYTFSGDSPFACEVLVDGRTVYQANKDFIGKTETEVYLLEGRHKITVNQQYMNFIGPQGDIDYIKLMYKKDGCKLPTDVMYYQLSQ